MVHGSTLLDHCPAPPSGTPPAAPASCQGRHRASAVLEWRACDGGDPAELVSAFLAGNGLPVRNIGRTATDVHRDGEGPLCGAALYVSAAAGCVMIGADPGAPSPVSLIPDVYAVVYAHTPFVPRRGDSPIVRQE